MLNLQLPNRRYYCLALALSLSLTLYTRENDNFEIGSNQNMNIFDQVVVSCEIDHRHICRKCRNSASQPLLKCASCVACQISDCVVSASMCSPFPSPIQYNYGIYNTHTCTPLAQRRNLDLSFYQNVL